MNRCRKCLLKELDGEYFKRLYEYIDSIPEALKASGAEYERRITACRGCDNLINGMCGLCGCFVEVRAVIAGNYCPDVKKKW